jgi:hypothetical protein
VHFARRGAAGDVDLLGLLDLDRLHMMDFSRGRRFRHVNRATAKNGASGRAGRQFRQCHPYRHDRCFPLFPGKTPNHHA